MRRPQGSRAPRNYLSPHRHHRHMRVLSRPPNLVCLLRLHQHQRENLEGPTLSDMARHVVQPRLRVPLGQSGKDAAARSAPAGPALRPRHRLHHGAGRRPQPFGTPEASIADGPFSLSRAEVGTVDRLEIHVKHCGSLFGAATVAV